MQQNTYIHLSEHSPNRSGQVFVIFDGRIFRRVADCFLSPNVSIIAIFRQQVIVPEARQTGAAVSGTTTTACWHQLARVYQRIGGRNYL